MCSTTVANTCQRNEKLNKQFPSYHNVFLEISWSNGQNCRGVQINNSNQKSLMVCCPVITPAKVTIPRFIINTNVYFTAVICVAFLCLACDKWQWHRKLTNPLVETCPGPGSLFEEAKQRIKSGVIAHYLIHASRFPADSDVNARSVSSSRRCILGNLLL